MSELNIVCCQFDIAWEDRQKNHSKVDGLMRAARPPRESLIILPEMFGTGFSMNVGVTADDDCKTHEFLSNLARTYDSTLIAGVVNREAENPVNQALIYAESGALVNSYSKVHLFPLAKEDQHYKPGRQIVVTEIGGFKVAPVICFDLRFPELFREAVGLGAELFVVIANWPESRAEHWCTLLQARAIENQAYVVGVNRCGRDPQFAYKGQSRIIDPTGTIVADAGDAECVVQATIDRDRLLSYRKDFPFLSCRR